MRKFEFLLMNILLCRFIIAQILKGSSPHCFSGYSIDCICATSEATVFCTSAVFQAIDQYTGIVLNQLPDHGFDTYFFYLQHRRSIQCETVEQYVLNKIPVLFRYYRIRTFYS